LSLSCEEATICNNGIVIISKASLSLYWGVLMPLTASERAEWIQYSTWAGN
jgi:hypothetical protein